MDCPVDMPGSGGEQIKAARSHVQIRL